MNVKKFRGEGETHGLPVQRNEGGAGQDKAPMSQFEKTSLRIRPGEGGSWITGLVKRGECCIPVKVRQQWTVL